MATAAATEDERKGFPVEHVKVRGFYRDGFHVHRGPNEGDSPDTIFVGPETSLGNFTLYLTPEMVVEIANRMLTENERAAIVGKGGAS